MLERYDEASERSSTGRRFPRGVGINRWPSRERLRVTRRITHEDLRQAVVAKSVYDKTSAASRLDAYRGGRDDIRSSGETRGSFIVPDGTELAADGNSASALALVHETRSR